MQKCTLMCLSDVRGEIAVWLRNRGADVRAEGTDSQWSTLEVVGRFRMTSLQRVRPGDQFSKIILGMHARFHRLEEPKSAAKERALTLITDTQLIVGVVLLEEGEEVEDLLFGAAAATGSCVFDGNVLMDGEREVLLMRH